MKPGESLMIKEVLKYQGNSKYICILALNEKDKLFVFYALTSGLVINAEKETTDYDLGLARKMIFSIYENYEINIPLKPTGQNHIFHIIEIDNEKEYEHICSVVESLV